MKYPQLYKSTELIDIVIGQLKKDPVTNNNIFKYIDEFQHKITDKYDAIVKQLPDYEKMEPYYLMMCKNIVPQTTMEKHKNHYIVTMGVINQLSEKYKKKVRVQRQLIDKIKLQKEYLGRVISAIKKLDKTTEILMGYQPEFKRIPNPRKLFTIVLVGVPNAGKTTFLTQLTDASPEINSYAFTTKSLNFGYFKKREEVIQVVDTPGLIHSEFKEMNSIEKQVIVAIKALADVIIFLYVKNQTYEHQKEVIDKIISENPDKMVRVYPSFGGHMEGYPNITKEQILNKEF